MSTNWSALVEEHELAYLRGDLATSLPESYSLDEMKAISDGMFESTARINAPISGACLPTHEKRCSTYLAHPIVKRANGGKLF